MYVIKCDGQVLHAPALFDDAAHVALSPHRKCEFNKADVLTFTLPITNVLHGKLYKKRSIITAERGGKQIFYGRVSDLQTDMLGRVSVTCEGLLNFLNDSLLRPYNFDDTAEKFLQLMLNKHNAQMPPEKHFSLGTVTAVTEDQHVKVKSEDYKNTLTEIQGLLVDNFGGYLRVRRENGVNYLDYLKEYTEDSGQTIEYGINLLDMTHASAGQNVFSVLVPLGTREGKTEKTTIESVNNGKDYLENAELIAQFGRIARRIVFPEVDSPEQLLKLGREKINAPLNTDTLTIRALDKCLFAPEGESVNGIDLGNAARIYSGPHKTDVVKRCCSIDEDMEKIENTRFVFGEPEKSIAASVASSMRKSSGALNHIKQTTYTVELMVKKQDELTKELTTVSVKLDAANDELDLRVKKGEVISYINMSPETVTISAGRVNLSGYVTASTLSAEIAEINKLLSGSATISYLKLSSMTLNGTYISSVKFHNVTINGVNYQLLGAP